MIYVVTGATGFLGVEFIKSLVDSDNIVYAIVRNEQKARLLLPLSNQIEIICSCLPEYKELDKYIPHADVFVNFAWDGITVDGRDIVDVQKLNIQYAKDAMLASKRMGCCLFVETGSQAEYGVINDYISEITPCHPFSEYGKAKLALSKVCDELSKSINMKYLHLRIFSVFGIRDHEHTLIKKGIEKLRHNIPLNLSSCEQNWNFLYVKDAVKQIMLLCEYAINNTTYKSEIFNIASEDTRKLKEFILELKDILQSTSELNFGVIQPLHMVSLNPNIEKLKSAINFVSSYTFSDAIKEIINSHNNI